MKGNVNESEGVYQNRAGEICGKTDSGNAPRVREETRILRELILAHSEPSSSRTVWLVIKRESHINHDCPSIEML